MDINLNNQNDNNENMFKKNNKNNKRNIFTNSFIFALLILILAATSVVSYVPIRNSYFNTEDNFEEYLGSYRFINDLSNLTRMLGQRMNNSDEHYYNTFLDANSIKYKASFVGETQNEDTIIQHPSKITMDRSIYNFDGFYSEVNTVAEEESYREIVEDVVEEQDDTVEVRKPLKNTILTNIPDFSQSKLDQEKEKSIMYIKLTFDEKGKPAIESQIGKSSKLNGIKFNEENFIDRLAYSDSRNLREYANLEIEYIIPQNFMEYNDAFTSSMKDHYAFPDYVTIILVIGAVSILLLVIIAFAVPYEVQNEISIIRLFNKMFLELKFTVWGLFILLVAAGFIPIDYIYNYSNYNIGSFIYDAGDLFYLLGIPLTFLLYLLIYLSTVYLKYIYYEGIRKGLIDNSFFGKIFLKCVKLALDCIKKATNTIKTLLSIDIREDNQRKLIGIAVMNFLVIVILGSGGFFGFVLAAIYSYMVLNYIMKIIDKAKELNKASSQVAEGNFNINLDDDMGILSPMAQNLNNINKGFSLAVDKEIKSQKMKSELISNVSHDLKTPLTSIITYVDLLKKPDIDPETQKEYINILDKKSQRLKILIEDLFEASKATSGNIDLQLEKIDVVALFRQTLGELEEKINESNLQFKINMPENKVICNLDGRRTYRVFENIITNILKYSMENSRVYIDIAESDHEVNFIFKNISAYEMNFDASEITERFTRGDESRNTEGSGLGLSIAKSFVELQGGTLEITIDGDLFKLIVMFPKVEII